MFAVKRLIYTRLLQNNSRYLEMNKTSLYALVSGAALVLSGDGCRSLKDRSEINKACIEHTMKRDAIEYIMNEDELVQERLGAGASFCEFRYNEPLSAHCNVNEGVLQDLQAVLDYAQPTIGGDMTLSVLVLDGGVIEPAPGFYSFFNGAMLTDARFFEEVDAISAAFAYKASHADFDIIAYFKKVGRNLKIPQPMLALGIALPKPLQMPPDDYDRKLQSEVRAGILAFVIGHETAHLLHLDGAKLVCGIDINTYDIELSADEMGASFVSTMPWIVEAAPLLLFKFWEVNGLGSNGECRDNETAYNPDTHPCPSLRYKNIRSQLLELGADTSTIDSVFGVPQ